MPARTYLAPARPIKHGRFFYPKAKDCARCPLKGDCLSKGRVNKVVVVGDDYPALLRARRRRERWSKQDRRLYRRHCWRSEGFHGETKTWHGLARAIRRGLPNMNIQAYLTTAAINLRKAARSRRRYMRARVRTASLYRATPSLGTRPLISSNGDRWSLCRGRRAGVRPASSESGVWQVFENTRHCGMSRSRQRRSRAAGSHPANRILTS
ncbi:transposase [Bradyrhizobium sacchari]|uniref:transposase n=1 Tax=Bradyrhizobium sacchari TaxID=1399419 RepID=UPI0013747ABE